MKNYIWTAENKQELNEYLKECDDYDVINKNNNNDSYYICYYWDGLDKPKTFLVRQKTMNAKVNEETKTKWRNENRIQKLIAELKVQLLDETLHIPYGFVKDHEGWETEYHEIVRSFKAAHKAIHECEYMGANL